MIEIRMDGMDGRTVAEKSKRHYLFLGLFLLNGFEHKTCTIKHRMEQGLTTIWIGGGGRREGGGGFGAKCGMVFEYKLHFENSSNCSGFLNGETPFYN